MEKPVLIIGAGIIGKSAFEVFNSNENLVYGFLDDNTKLHGELIGETSIFSDTNDDNYLRIIGKDCEVFIAEDNNTVKKNLLKTILNKYKTMPVNAIHKNSYLSASTVMGHGNLINAGVSTDYEVNIGNHCILLGNTLVGTSSKIGDFVQIGAGSSIGSEVVIEDDVFIGAGVTIVSGVTIHKNARIGAGSVIVSNVEKNATMFGNPAQKIEK